MFEAADGLGDAPASIAASRWFPFDEMYGAEKSRQQTVEAYLKEAAKQPGKVDLAT